MSGFLRISGTTYDLTFGYTLQFVLVRKSLTLGRLLRVSRYNVFGDSGQCPMTPIVPECFVRSRVVLLWGSWLGSSLIVF